jgi:multiple sugar transport system permease protein
MGRGPPRSSSSPCPIQIALGLGIALLLHRPGLGFFKTLTRLSLILPMATTYAVVGLLGAGDVQQLRRGEPDARLDRGRAGQLARRPDQRLRRPWSILDIWQWTPFVTLIFLAGLSTVPGEIEEAARSRPRAGGRCCATSSFPS